MNRPKEEKEGKLANRDRKDEKKVSVDADEKKKAENSEK